MSTALGSLGITGSAPSTPPATPVENVDPLGPVETVPGVFYDAKKAKEEYGFSSPKTEGFFDGFKRFFSGEFIGQVPPAGALSVSEGALNPLRIPGVDEKMRELLPDVNILDYETFPDIETDSSGLPVLDSQGRPIFKTDEVDAMRATSKEMFDTRRMERLAPKAAEFGVGIVPGYESTVISDLIEEKSQLTNLDGQNLLYLADTPEQYMNVMEQLFGEGNVRMITDDGQNYSFFAPRNYVSVRQDGGEFTDFAPATVGYADFMERYFPGVVAETAAYLPVIPLAMKTSAVAASLSGPLSVITGPGVFIYTLFAGSKAVEKGRQSFQDYMGLNDEQADAWESYMDVLVGVTDNVKEIVFPEFVQDFMDDSVSGEAGFIREDGSIDISTLLFSPSDNVPGSTPRETMQQIAGGIEATLGTIPGFRAMFRTATSKLYESGAIDVVSAKIKSAVDTQANVVRTMGQGAAKLKDPLFLGTENALQYLTVPQILKSKVVGRLTSLVSQSSVKIEEALRKQMQSAANYIDTYKGKFGGGNFKEYLKAVEGIGTTLNSYKNAAPPELAATDRSLVPLGENIGTLEEVFLAMRAMASEGQYNNIFSQLKGASYDLNSVRDLVPANIREVIPTTDAAAKPKTPIDPGQVSPVKGEMQFETLLDEIMSLGTTQADGTRLLSKNAITAAVKKFQKDHPEFNFDPADVTSPAELIHLYAKRFGDLAANTFGEGKQAANPGRYTQSIEMRTALLALIGNPRGVSDDVAASVRNDLAAANDYSSETFKLTQTAVQKQSRIVRRDRGETPESGQLARDLLFPAQEQTVTVRNIAEQSAQVTEFLSNPQNVTDFKAYLTKKGKRLAGELDERAPVAVKAFDDLQAYFKNRLDDALYRMSTTDTSIQGTPKSLDDVLAEFKDPELRRLLGLSEAAEEQLRADASMLARFQDSPILADARKMLGEGANFRELFAKIDFSDTDAVRTALNDLALPIRRATSPEAKAKIAEDLRKGLIDFVFSANSGVLTKSTKSGVIEDYGDIIVDGDRLSQLLDILDDAGAFREILKDTDKGVMDMLAQYSGIVKAQIADAGSALSGAQVIGNMFTLDPRKFAGGIARLSAQGRIASLLINPKMVDAMMGQGKPMTRAEKIQNLFFGKTSVGTIVLLEAMRDDGRDVNQQTEEALTVEVPVSPSLQSLGVQP